jgi:hypothetical protein
MNPTIPAELYASLRYAELRQEGARERLSAAATATGRSAFRRLVHLAGVALSHLEIRARLVAQRAVPRRRPA